MLNWNGIPMLQAEVVAAGGGRPQIKQQDLRRLLRSRDWEQRMDPHLSLILKPQAAKNPKLILGANKDALPINAKLRVWSTGETCRMQAPPRCAACGRAGGKENILPSPSQKTTYCLLLLVLLLLLLLIANCSC